MDGDYKLYGNFPRCGKSYMSEKFNELYTSMVKKSIEATVSVVDEYIKYWSNRNVQEFHYDVSPVEVLKELRKTLITGEFSEEMIETLKMIYDGEKKI